MKVITRETLEALQASQPKDDPDALFVEGAKFILKMILEKTNYGNKLN